MEFPKKHSDRKKQQEAQLLLRDRATRQLDWNDLQMFFMVIKSGTNWNLLYNFLLVFSIFIVTVVVSHTACEKYDMTLKYRQGHRHSHHV